MTATGTVVSPEGHVLTSAHVLTGDSYKIMLRRGEKAITYDARIAAPSVGWCDMGLLRIDDYSVMPGAFPTLPLRGPGEGIGQDEKIIIAGYPFGDSITGDRSGYGARRHNRAVYESDRRSGSPRLHRHVRKVRKLRQPSHIRERRQGYRRILGHDML